MPSILKQAQKRTTTTPKSRRRRSTNEAIKTEEELKTTKTEIKNARSSAKSRGTRRRLDSYLKTRKGGSREASERYQMGPVVKSAEVSGLSGEPLGPATTVTVDGSKSLMLP
ncbi:hypothetical protein H6P81_011518 [Aristolochia fimbriata]|uniref:Uncharacterized protein n=1 Tax=Aristolochia fimbriata TaxID=158543 RepID=A0AAV7ERR2_ARIFI|nr:hypothetical protein H6P81_011518 [Aristolochia fimbriata]